MQTRVIRVLALGSALALVAPFALAQADKKKAGAPPMDEKAVMEAWAKYASPGSEHKSIEKLAGTWTGTVKSFMQPGAPPQESSGTAEMKMVLGGRWLEQRFEGTFMGQPYSGVGYIGYDNYKKRYVSTWADTASTAMMVTEGTMAKDGSITSTGKVDDFMLKKAVTVKTKASFPDADTMLYEMWSPGHDGKSAKVLEVKYTRKK